MKKKVFGRQFKRDTNERKALFRGLASSLVMHEQIKTTEEKAKAMRGQVEKLVTKARTKDTVQAGRLLMPYLSASAVSKMINEIAPRFSNRPGGYTRIIKLGNRFSDNASMVVMEWVEKGTKNIKQKTKNGTKKTEEVAQESAKATNPKASAKKTEKKEPKTTTKKTATKTTKAKKEKASK